MLRGPLGFVDRAWTAPNGKTLSIRQLTVDGLPLDDTLAAAGVMDAGSAPLVDDPRNAVENTIYLRSLLGAPPADPLRMGRIGLLFCRHCLDSSCGELLAARLEIAEHEVRWSAIGFELEHFGTVTRNRFTREVLSPPEWWTPQPLDPQIVITFDREQYFCAVEGELDRLNHVKEET